MRSLLCSASPAWRSRQLVITPEQLGLRSVGECQQRVERLGLTPLPMLPYRQEYWRLDALLAWSRGNGFDRLPMLGNGSPRAESRGSHGAA
ncbi:MAG TPA: hypothetical protein VE907_07900 [Gammaproteobacteria bacterium]|nr:hypothetical protein [Gammaproteobacteria bacterium]